MRALLRVLRPQHNEVNNMSQNAPVHSNSFPSGRPVVFRNATVLTIDPSLGTIERGDVLVVDNRIAEVGRQINAPDSAVEIDASGGILMPGMVDTHRHMWQTALRGFGADWTLTNYFMFYYINWARSSALRIFMLVNFCPPMRPLTLALPPRLTGLPACKLSNTLKQQW